MHRSRYHPESIRIRIRTGSRTKNSEAFPHPFDEHISISIGSHEAFPSQNRLLRCCPRRKVRTAKGFSSKERKGARNSLAFWRFFFFSCFFPLTNGRLDVGLLGMVRFDVLQTGPTPGRPANTNRSVARSVRVAESARGEVFRSSKKGHVPWHRPFLKGKDSETGTSTEELR